MTGKRFGIAGLAVLMMALSSAAQATNFAILLSGGGGEAVEVDCDSAEIDDLLIDEREITTGLDVAYRKRPGKVKYMNITLKRGMVTDPAGVAQEPDELQTWWREVSSGKNIRKNISIMWIKREGEVPDGTQTSYTFLDCIPEDYVVTEEVGPDGTPVTQESFLIVAAGVHMHAGKISGDNTPIIRGSITDEAGVAVQENGLTGWGGGQLAPVLPLPGLDTRYHTPSPRTVVTNLTLTKEGEPGSEAIYSWINAIAAGDDARRTIRIREVRPAGRGGKTYTYFDCFPIRYVFPKFNNQSDTYIVEEIEFVCERVERA